METYILDNYVDGLTLTHVNFDLDLCDLCMNYYPVIFGQVHTDRWTDRQKVMHMSPPCKMHRWAQKLIKTNINT